MINPFNKYHPFDTKCFEEIRFEDKYKEPSHKPSTIFTNNEYQVQESDCKSKKESASGSNPQSDPLQPTTDAVDSVHCSKCKSLKRELTKYKQATTGKLNELKQKLISQRQEYQNQIEQNKTANKILINNNTEIIRAKFH